MQNKCYATTLNVVLFSCLALTVIGFQKLSSHWALSIAWNAAVALLWN